MEGLNASGIKQKEPNMNNSMYDYQTNPSVNLKFRFCIGQCNPEIGLQFLGIWWPVLRTLLNHVASIYDKKPRKILSQIFDNSLNVCGNKL